MLPINGQGESRGPDNTERGGFRDSLQRTPRWLPDILAIATACAFIFLAACRIQLPGLYMDEVDFVNAAQGASDNTMIHIPPGTRAPLTKSRALADHVHV